MAVTADSPAQGMSKADFDRFVPLNGFIIVQREDQEPRYGKIILVADREDDRRKHPTPAVVVRLGRPDVDKKRGRPVPRELRPGDRVIIDKYAGYDIEIIESGERYVLVQEPDVLLVREDAA